jgi:hypothetical protein
VADHKWRNPHDHRQEWRPEQHVDLDRIGCAEKARGRDPFEPRQTARHKDGAPDTS